jgi:hypothetical protein
MSNNSFALILGHGSAIIYLNRTMILSWDCLHVLDLCNPLYSLRAHQHQQGCNYIGMYGLGIHEFFPTFIHEVDTVPNCHLQYELIGYQTSLDQLDFI